MNFQERISRITALTNDYLRRYRRPEHLDTNQSLIEIRAIAESLNSRIAASVQAESLDNLTHDIFRDVSENHRGRDWPVIAEFVKAADKVSAQAGGKTEVIPMTPIEISAQRILDGEQVGQGWLYGAMSVDLERSGQIEPAKLEAYRSEHERNLRRQYREQADAMIRELWQKHERARADYEPMMQQREIKRRNLHIPNMRPEAAE